MKHPRWRVPELWKGATVCILGGGPSLTAAQVEACRRRVRVIAVNTSYQLAPWADILYFCDEAWYGWWRDSESFRNFGGIKVALQNARSWEWDKEIKVLENYGGPEAQTGLCEIRDGVYTGRNSGNQAIQLAAHLGAKRILLLGFDMRADGPRTHWHMTHRRPTPPEDFKNSMLPWFAPLVEPLRRRGVEVVNCTPGSAIDCFQKMAIEEVLAIVEREAVEERARTEARQREEYCFRTG